tara:strand:+ start:15 stop:281 length:267 start_codon:yes stop_codon:yes gene_type:complete
LQSRTLPKIKREKPVFWQWSKGKAIRLEKYKAVFSGKDWAMYEMSINLLETNGLKEKYPQKFSCYEKIYDCYQFTISLCFTSTRRKGF